jgi:hypothetical protein
MYRDVYCILWFYSTFSFIHRLNSLLRCLMAVVEKTCFSHLCDGQSPGEYHSLYLLHYTVVVFIGLYSVRLYSVFVFYQVTSAVFLEGIIMLSGYYWGECQYSLIY